MATTYLSPIGNEQQNDQNGAPLSGGFIYTYLAGTVTPVATYMDNSGAVGQANPIVLNSSGLPNNPIWLPAGQAVKLVIQNAAGVTQRTVDNVTGINDPAAGSSVSEWAAFTGTPTFVSATSFSVGGDQTNVLQVGRRTKTANSGGTIYSTITASSYNSGTNRTSVTVANDSGVLDVGLSALSYGFLSSTNPSVPGLKAQDLSGSRALATTYTNSTGRPIFVHVRAASTSATQTSIALLIDGTVTLTSTTLAATNSGTQVSALVPAGSTYRADITGTGTLNQWVEVR